MENRSSAISILRSKFQGFSKSEKKVAHWILENAEQFRDCSMAEVANHCGVSDTTVLRLCRSAGFKGYTDMRFAIVEDTVNPTQVIHDDIKEDDDLTNVVSKVFASNVQSLKDTLQIIDFDKLQEVITAIKKANRILFCGEGASYLIAQSAYQQLRRLDIPCAAPFDSHLQIVEASLLKPNDLAVAITHSGMTRDPSTVLELAKEQGAKTICITSNPSSPITKFTDITLVSVVHETRNDSISSRTAQLAIFDAIYVALSLENPAETMHRERHITSSLSTKTI
ncbi:MAG: MurR/RpiR family transcriptional regulator [Desulfovibrionales bacterium]|nr:MurR/RpiR family transcriptional regulator [Desulfovibrionales bacterium]